MSGKRIIIGQSEWALPDEGAESVVNDIKTALQDGTLATLALVDIAGRPVTVYLNGKTAQSVAVDLNDAPKPGEIS